MLLCHLQVAERNGTNEEELVVLNSRSKETQNMVAWAGTTSANCSFCGLSSFATASGVFKFLVITTTKLEY